MSRAAVVLPCADLAATQAFFEELGFRLESISPADDPEVVALEGLGLRLLLDRRAHGDPGTLRLEDGRAATQIAPNGTHVEHVPPQGLVLPPLRAAFHLERAADARWHVGRAGMRYRDLVPDRQGGRIIASHIHIPDAGPVPDYVHFHAIRFQLIYCHRGWVRVVYQDQGEPFVMRPGDCVLQPPGIRHRVLEAGDDTQVVEVASPARHDTFADHALTLPTGTKERDFGGQRFARTIADIGPASGGVVSVSVVGALPPAAHDSELVFLFVLRGAATLEHDGERTPMTEADSVAIPPGMRFALADATGDLQTLRVDVR